MERLTSVAGKTYRHFMHDSLYRNSIYLILSSVTSALLGLVFWGVAAHAYSPNIIGIVVTLSSVVAFLGTLSQLGLTNALIRFLPASQDSEDMVSISFTVTTMLSIIGAFVAVCLLIIFEPKTSVLIKTSSGLSLFLIYSITNLIGTMVDAVFTAHRKAGYVLARNIVTGVSKPILAIFFVRYGSSGLFSSIALSFAISAFIGLYLLAKKDRLRIRYSVSRKLLIWANFSLVNYVSGLTSSAVVLILPLIILKDLGASATAYYYIAYTISTGLRFIPQGIAQSLFAEGSNSIATLKEHTLKAIKFLTILMLPIGVMMFILASYILLIFGKSYSQESVACLRILILVALVSTINYLGDTLLNTGKRMRLYMATNLLSAISTLLFVIPLLRFGLPGVAWGWFFSEVSVAALYIWLFRDSIRRMIHARGT